MSTANVFLKKYFILKIRIIFIKKNHFHKDSDHYLIQLMRQHSLNWFTFETFRDFLNRIRDNVRLKKYRRLISIS